MKSFLRITMTVITLIVVIGFTGVMYFPQLIGYKPFAVMSDSVEPDVHKGDLAYINTGDHDLQEGDIIVCRVKVDEGEESFVMQRVSSVDENGDVLVSGNDTEGEIKVSASSVLGTHAGSVAKIGAAIYKLGMRGIQACAAWVLLLNAFVLVITTVPGRKRQNKTEKLDNE